jgi:hypothetical protein
MEDFFARVEEAIVACDSAAAALRFGLTEENAEEACMACRSAVQLFFFARTDFGSEITEKAKPLVSSLQSIRSSLAQMVSHGASEAVQGYLENVNRRGAVLEALAKDNPGLVKRLLKQELEAVGH